VTRRHVIDTIMTIGGERTNNQYTRDRVIGKAKAKLTLVEPIREETSTTMLEDDAPNTYRILEVIMEENGL
jgi:hypothetical protein